MNDAAIAFERASRALSDPSTRQSAEQTLLDLRRRPDARETAKSVLAHAHAKDALFQAAATFRVAALRDWGALDDAARKSLREFALQWTLERTDADRVVRNQMSATTAVFIKRACVDADDSVKMAMLAECEGTVRAKSGEGSSSSDARTIGLEVFAAVVSEFAPGTASELGTTWEKHERCRASAEKNFLKPFFVHGCDAAKACVEDGSVGNGSDRGACAAALRLMNGVLSWDFNRDVSYGFRGRAFPSTDSAANAFVKLTPGIEWRDVLLNPGALDWLFDLHAAAENVVLGGERGGGGGGGERRNASPARAERR